MKVYIFDMDGTFIDSMDYWNNVMNHYLESKGLKSYDSLQEEILNMTLVEAIGYVIETFNLDLTIKEMEEELKHLIGYNYKNVFNIDRDAIEIFRAIKARGDKLVLATATQRSLVDVVLDRFNLSGYFDLELVSDEVDLHKDDSRYFERICDHFRVKAGDCVLVEDALYSMRSGKSIGMNIVAIVGQAAKGHLDQIRQISSAYGNNLGEVKEYFLNNG